MNDGMKIILERMKTHPEEFQPDYSNPRTQGKNKWEVLIDKYEKNLNPEDIHAFAEAFDAMHQEQFTAQVMKELMGSEEDEGSLGKQWFTSNRGNVTLSAGATLGQFTTTPYSVGTGTINTGSITLGNQILDESTVEHMKAHIEALQVKDRNALVKKPHKTIFGKLWNYL